MSFLGTDIGWGIVIADDAVLTDTYVDWVGVVDGEVPSLEVEDAPTTHLLSPNRIKEYTPGLKEPGTITLTQNYDPAEFSRLLTLQNQGSATKPKTFKVRITFNDFASTKSKAVFSAYVKKVSLPFNDKTLQFKTTLKITGAVTFTAGS